MRTIWKDQLLELHHRLFCTRPGRTSQLPPMSRYSAVSHDACRQRLPSRHPAESPGGQARYPAPQRPSWMDTRHRRCVVHSLDGPASCTLSAVGAGFMWLHHWVCNKTMHVQDHGMPCTDVYMCQCSWY